LTYKRLSVYLTRRRGLQLSRLAGLEGWEKSDLIRVLLTIGILKKFEDQTKTRRKMTEGPLFDRRKAIQRVHRRGVILDLRLPHGLFSILDACARRAGMSRNEAVTNFLQVGIAAYCEAEISFAEALKMYHQN